jgi:hypothetical protein
MSRNRLTAVLIALGGVALATGACAAPTTGTGSTTTAPTWVPAGCIDGAGTDGTLAPDLLYSGLPNRRGNATISTNYTGGVFIVSGDGSCSGLPVAAITIVRAADKSAADTQCTALGAGTATSFAGTPWTLPADGWSCSETITL